MKTVLVVSWTEFGKKSESLLGIEKSTGAKGRGNKDRRNACGKKELWGLSSGCTFME